MKYRISTIGKIKSNDEDLITRKYLKRIKNIELKQYEVKIKNKEKQLDKEADKLINSTPKYGKLILLDEEGENLSSSDLAKLILNWSNNNITSVNFAIGGAFGNGMKIKKTLKILYCGNHLIKMSLHGILPGEKVDQDGI